MMVLAGMIVAVFAVIFLFWLNAKSNALAKREQPNTSERNR
jgi:hypothetical protein